MTAQVSLSFRARAIAKLYLLLTVDVVVAEELGVAGLARERKRVQLVIAHVREYQRGPLRLLMLPRLVVGLLANRVGEETDVSLLV